MHLVIKNLSSGYDGKVIFENINFTFSSGLTILIGANGIGKTTLLRTCAGVILPYSGKLFYENANGNSGSMNNKISYVPHRSVHYSRLTGRQHLHYWALVYNIERSAADAATEKMIQELGMESFIDDKTEVYSRGQLQRLCILQCLVFDPDILFLDEPVAGLDPESKEKIIALLIRYANTRERIIVATSHEGDNLNSRADYVVKMDKNALSYQNTESANS